MSRAVQLALAAAAIARRLLPAASPASNLLLYHEQKSGPCAYQRFQAKIVDRFGYQVRHVFNRRIRMRN